MNKDKVKGWEEDEIQNVISGKESTTDKDDVREGGTKTRNKMTIF